MATVIANADGCVLLDAKMGTKGIDAGAANIKGQFAKMAQSASQASQQIEKALTGSFSKAEDAALLTVRSLESQYNSLQAKLSEAMTAGDSTGAAQITAEMDALFVKIEEARQGLYNVLSAAAAARTRAAVTADQVAAAGQAANKGAEEADDAAQDIADAAEKTAKNVVDAAEDAAEGVVDAVKKEKKEESKNAKNAEKSTKRTSKTLGRFGTRLSGIAMSAFLFNSLSAGFRDIAEYIGGAITSTDEMKTALANLKGAAQQAAAPIIQAITPALTALANAAATAVSYVAQLFAAFSGKSMAQVAESAKSFNKASKAAGKLSRSVAGFDQLTKLQDSSGGGSSGEIEPNYDFVAEPVAFLELMKQQILEGDWYGAGKTAGEKLAEGINNYDWNGLGEKIGGVIGNAISFVLGLALQIKPETINGALNSFFGGLFKGIANAMQKIDWVDVGKNLLDFLLFGLGMSNPATAIWTLLLSPNTDELFAGFFELVGTIVAGILQAIVGLFRGGKEKWNEVKEAFSDGFWQAIKDAFVGVGEWIKTNIWDPFVEGFVDCIDWEDPTFDVIDGLWEGIKHAWETRSYWFESVWDSFLALFKDFFGINSPSTVMEDGGSDIMAGLFNGLLGGAGRLTEICGTLWKTITDAFAGLGQWFETTFGEAWQAVLDIFSGDSATFEGIKESFNTTFKDVFNKLAEGINKVIRTPFNKVNSMLNKIRGWEIAGATPFKGLWDYNPISIPQIPYLAKGAVIPPNAPFLAMLGDQRHGTNIEAPLSTIQEAVAAVMEEYSAANMAGHSATVAVLREILEAVLGIEIGDDVLANAVKRYQTKMAIVRGG